MSAIDQVAGRDRLLSHIHHSACRIPEPIKQQEHNTPCFRYRFGGQSRFRNQTERALRSHKKPRHIDRILCQQIVQLIA